MSQVQVLEVVCFQPFTSQEEAQVFEFSIVSSCARGGIYGKTVCRPFLLTSVWDFSS